MRYSTDVTIFGTLLCFFVYHVTFTTSDHLENRRCSVALEMVSGSCGTILENVTFRDEQGTTLPITATVHGEHIVGLPCQNDFLMTASKPGYATKQLTVQPQAAKRIYMQCRGSAICLNTTLRVNVASACGWSVAGASMTSPSVITPSTTLSDGALSMAVCGLPSTVSVFHPNHVTSTAQVLSTSTAIALACESCTPLPAVTNSTFVVIDNNKLQYTCNPGYKLVGMATVVCLDKSWSQAPSCSLIPVCDVPPPIPHAQYVRPPDTLVGGSVQYVCESPYIHASDPFAVCLRNLTWGELPSCVIVPGCDVPPSILHGQNVGPPDTLVGGSVQYVCDSPYIHASDPFAVCLRNLTWGELPSCIIDCGAPPDVANAVRISQPSTMVGALASYTCPEPYVLTGNPLLVCQANGDWATPPTCLLGCGTVPTITGALYPVPASTVVGSTVTYTCAPDLHFVGNNQITCLASGQWSPTPLPECVEYELLFRGISGNSVDFYDAWISGDATTSTDPLCMALEDNACTTHYRNPKADTWSALDIECVRLSVYSGTTEVAYAVFDGTGTDLLNWFNPDKLIETTWTDMLAETSADFQFFSLLGDNEREFFTVGPYTGCATDKSYLVVVVGDAYPCTFDGIGPFPRILYAVGSSAGFPETLTGLAVGDYVTISYKT